MTNLSYHNLLINYLASGLPILVGKGNNHDGDCHGVIIAHHHQSDEALTNIFSCLGIAEPIYFIEQKHGETTFHVTQNGKAMASDEFSDELQELWHYFFGFLHPLPIPNILVFSPSAPAQDAIIKPAFINFAQLQSITIKNRYHQAYKIAETTLPLKSANKNKRVNLHLYQGEAGFSPTAMIAIGALDNNHDKPLLLRLHSECFTGDVLSSRKCDCGHQLNHALEKIFTAENGIILYLPQEGRGIGLPSKLKAYHLQETENLDTVEANQKLGLAVDNRNFSFAINILKQWNIQHVRLLSNNPHKKDVLEQSGIMVHEMVPLLSGINQDNKDYMITKKNKLHHIIE